jgi:hypothetical protein
MTGRLPTAALLVVLATGLAACGGSSEDNQSTGGSQPLASAADFPTPKGKTMMQMRRGLGPGPVLAPTVQQLVPGKQRYGFALFTTARKQISGIPVALYLQPSGGTKLTGPFPARDLSLDVAPPYQSETVAKDPDAAKSLYVSHVKIPKPGTYAVMAVAKLDDRLVATDPIGARVLKTDPVPDVGDKAPVVDTPTVESAGGDVQTIDTRTPPGTMHEESFKGVAGKKPALLLFATPALCQSRVCGPVVDIAEEVKAEHKDDDIAFIHQEIYKDNKILPGCLEGQRPQSQCLRPQVLAYHLQTEPWAFAIDRNGRIAARLEGAYSRSELEAAVKAAEQG